MKELSEAARQKMIPAYKKKTNSAGAVCLVTMIGAAVWVTLSDPKQVGLGSVAVPLLSLVAGIAFICACWFHIKAKGRSGWWILVLVFNLLGLVILALLRDRANWDENKVA